MKIDSVSAYRVHNVSKRTKNNLAANYNNTFKANNIPSLKSRVLGHASLFACVGAIMGLVIGCDLRDIPIIALFGSFVGALLGYEKHYDEKCKNHGVKI